MAINKNALIRYKTIDKCLQNHYRKWTLNDLIEACSDALYEYEGKDTYVSKRTVQLDIQNMRSDKLGYNAPIVVVDRKYYIYEDKNYSITNLPISSQDLERLSESVAFLKQFKGFAHFNELNGVIQKLEDHVYSKQTSTKSVIDFEKNENLKGLELLDRLYQTIIKKETINITYQSFKARFAASFDFHAYLLKEYRNRWFVIGKRHKQNHIVNLALDRIISIENSSVAFIDNTSIDFDEYFSKTIGVSVNSNLETEKVLLFVTHKHAPYVLTKPFHSSQKLIKRDNYGLVISLDIQHNFELEKEILGFGEGITVLSPPFLKRKITERLQLAVDNYNTEITEKGLTTAKKRLLYKGSTILNSVFSKREIKHIRQAINLYYRENGKEVIISNLFEKIPKLKNTIFNKNSDIIFKNVNSSYQFKEATYYANTPKNYLKASWHQREIKGSNIDKDSLIVRIHFEDTSEIKGVIKAIFGTHNKGLTKEEIELISENSTPTNCAVFEGGIHIMSSRLLHQHSSINQHAKNEIIELMFVKDKT